MIKAGTCGAMCFKVVEWADGVEDYAREIAGLLGGAAPCFGPPPPAYAVLTYADGYSVRVDKGA